MHMHTQQRITRALIIKSTDRVQRVTDDSSLPTLEVPDLLPRIEELSR